MNKHFCVYVSEGKLYNGRVVAPHVPRTEGGLYWGYSVRLASCLSEFFSFIHLPRPPFMKLCSSSRDVFLQVQCSQSARIKRVTI